MILALAIYQHTFTVYTFLWFNWLEPEFEAKLKYKYEHSRSPLVFILLPKRFVKEYKSWLETALYQKMR